MNRQCQTHKERKTVTTNQNKTKQNKTKEDHKRSCFVPFSNRWQTKRPRRIFLLVNFDWEWKRFQKEIFEIFFSFGTGSTQTFLFCLKVGQERFDWRFVSMLPFWCVSKESRRLFVTDPLYHFKNVSDVRGHRDLEIEHSSGTFFDQILNNNQT